jgi:putative ATP-dependent endonuclease of OLD family
MQVSRLSIENFRGISKAELHFSGHTLLIGGNNVGKSTICEALDLVLGPDRLYKTPAVEEFDFRNARYLTEDGTTPVPIRIEVVLTNLTEDITRQCANNVECWHKTERRLLAAGEIDAVDKDVVEFCLRLITLAAYDPEEDQFNAKTVYGHSETEIEDERRNIPTRVKRSIGFLYLRTLRTGSKALSLERGSLLDTILRLKELRTGLWERIRNRLATLDPPIDADATELSPVLDEIEARLTEYIATAGDERSTRLFVSQLTREHLRKTIAFFLSMCEGEAPVPFQEAGTGTLNALVLALLTFIAEIKKDNVIFAMEEPEIALPPHTQRRIANYLLTQTTQCFITSHSPYIIERFEPESIMRLTRDAAGSLTATQVALPASMKAKTYRSQLRRTIAEAMLGQGAIVGEGITEQLAIMTVAKKMEEADPELFPLDLAGVTVINTEGDGNLEAIGAFFKALDIPAFGFVDNKNRKAEEIAQMSGSFTSVTQIPYKGAETLIAAETPMDRQWQFLQLVRADDGSASFGIPSKQPVPDELRELTIATLKRLKGEGGGARLLELCSTGELPPTIVGFLKAIYARFPKPKRQLLKAAGSESAGDSPEISSTAAADETHLPLEASAKTKDEPNTAT